MTAKWLTGTQYISLRFQRKDLKLAVFFAQRQFESSQELAHEEKKQGQGLIGYVHIIIKHESRMRCSVKLQKKNSHWLHYYECDGMKT